ncbi:MAG TPA: hypothetical protein VN706_02215 [Gemmatimonadaceae bacterium]|nr:hypothetical protein [Gemmatimonadaceae bacterium]
MRRISFIPFALGVLAVAPLHAQSKIRTRIVGVYDEVTGEALDGVEITDLGTGLKSQTTKTGSLALFLSDTTGTMLRVRKLGYDVQLLTIGTARADTTPITLMLHPSAVSLPAVVSKAHNNLRGPADTVRKLELNGFYDRRLTTGAPTSSFVTADKIARMTLVSDVARLSGRPFCTSNLYLNGVRVMDMGSVVRQAFGKGRTPNQLNSNPVDQLVMPDQVLAIEFYRTSDMPVEFAASMRGGAAGCATLIWTK